jgi:hypothetical protein
MATITVERTGDGSGPVSVEYLSDDSSAIQGSDYEPAAGTLSWGDGDTSPKSFTVNILSDTETELTETVKLSLNNPVGIGLGSQLTAEIAIQDTNCEQLASDITTDTTLTNNCYHVTQTISVESGATLTVDPAVTLTFDAGTQLDVREDGALTAIGAAERKRHRVIGAASSSPSLIM